MSKSSLRSRGWALPAAVLVSVFLGAAPIAAHPPAGPARPGVPQISPDVHGKGLSDVRVQHGWLKKLAAVQRYRSQRFSVGLSPLSSTTPRVEGTLAIPLLAGKFANTGADPISEAVLQQQLFDGPNATGTLTDYFDEVSYSFLNVTGSVFGAQGGGLFQVSQNDTYYESGCNGLCGSFGEYIQELLNGADSWVDFSLYDNDGPDGVPNSGDDDGYVDLLALTHPETGGECGTANVWYHISTYENWFAAAYVTNDAAVGGGFIQISDYVVSPTVSCDGVNPIEIGVLTHLISRGLGLPPLFDSDSSNGTSHGIGEWGVLASGNWGGDGVHPETPTHPCAWTKEQLGWIDPVEVCSDSMGIQLNAIEKPGASVVKIHLQGASGEEYFLLENRTQTGFDTYLPASGVAIWHIDNHRPNNGDESLKLVDLEAADGQLDLDTETNRGDAGDVFPGSTANTSFTNTTIPNTKNNNRTNSGVSIIAISGPDSARTLNITLARACARWGAAGLIVDDSPWGNNNGSLDSFERSDLLVPLISSMPNDVLDVYALLTSQTPGVTVLQDSVYYGTLVCGMENAGTGSYEIESTTSMADGQPIVFEVAIITGLGTERDTLAMGAGKYILIVEDDAGAGNVAYFTDAVIGAGESFFEPGSMPFDPPPGSKLFRNAPAVAWIIGEAWSGTLTPGEQDFLAHYLDAGGRLFLSGQDVGYDLVQTGHALDQTFYADYLHAVYTTDDSGDQLLDGVFGDPIGNGLSLDLTGGAANSTYPSVISALSGAGAVFEYSPGNTGAIRWEGSVYSMVYFAFNFESITGQATRDTTMSRILNWLWPDDMTPPTVNLLGPVGAETFNECASIPITWNAGDNVGVVGVDIYVSSDGGQSYVPVASDLPNTGSYGWDPSCATGTYRVKIVSRDAEGLQDVMGGGDFSVVSVPPDPGYSSLPDRVIMTPNGGALVSVIVANTYGPVPFVQVTLTVSAAADSLVRWGQGQAHPVIAATTNGSGVASFSIRGGLCPGLGNEVTIYAGGVFLGSRSLISPDVVTDLCQSPSDSGFVECGDLRVSQVDMDHLRANLDSASVCLDFDADGWVTAADSVFMAGYMNTSGTPEVAWPSCGTGLSRQDAIGLVITDLIVGSPEESTTVAFLYNKVGPDSLLLEGTIVSPWDSTFQHVIPCATYFLWIDRRTDQEWEHEASFVFVDALTGNYQVEEGWSWPMVNGTEIDRFLQEGNASQEIVFGQYKVDSNFYNYTPVTTTNKDDWAIIVVGKNVTGDQERKARVNDVARIVQTLNGAPMGPKLDKDNITVVAGAGYTGDTKENICSAIEALTGCGKLYFFYIGHGSKERRNHKKEFKEGGMTVRGEKFTYTELACKLLETPAQEVCIIIEDCYSGQAIEKVAAKEVEKDGKKSKVKGAVITSSGPDNKTTRHPDGAPFIKGIYACANDPLADLDGDGMITYEEALIWAATRETAIQGDGPLISHLSDASSVVIGPSTIKRIKKPKRPPTGTSFPYDAVEIKYTVTDTEGIRTEYVRQFLYGTNNDKAPIKTIFKGRVRCADGSSIDFSADIPGKTRKCLVELPSGWKRYELLPAHLDKMPPHQLVSQLGDSSWVFPSRASRYARNEFIYHDLEVPGNTGDAFTTSINGPPGWDLTSYPAAFTNPALVDTPVVLLRGVMPDTATQGGFIDWQVVNVTTQDTTLFEIHAMLFDTTISVLGGGQQFTHQAIDAYAGMNVAADSLVLRSTRINFVTPAAAQVLAGGKLVVDDGTFISDPAVDYTLTVSGALAWENGALIDSQDGLHLAGASGAIDFGAVIRSRGDGLVLSGDLGGLDFETFLVDSTTGNGLVLDAASHFLLRGLRVENSGGQDVVARNNAMGKLLDCSFDDAKVTVESGSEIMRTWTVNFDLRTHTGAAIYGVPVEVRDVFGTTVGVDTSGTNGVTGNFTLCQYVETDFGRFDHNPHQVFMSYAGKDTVVTYSALQQEFVTIVLTDSTQTGFDPDPTPAVYLLAQNKPNPVRGATNITYDLPQASGVQLRVFDVRGREVATLVDKWESEGRYTIDWQVDSKLPNGVYFYHLRAGEFVSTKKLTLLR